jgi:hypothetical protein
MTVTQVVEPHDDEEWPLRLAVARAWAGEVERPVPPRAGRSNTPLGLGTLTAGCGRCVADGDCWTARVCTGFPER